MHSIDFKCLDAISVRIEPSSLPQYCSVFKPFDQCSLLVQFEENTDNKKVTYNYSITGYVMVSELMI
jgi:hypothetical protein